MSMSAKALDKTNRYSYNSRRAPGCGQEGLLADLALDGLGLLVDLELRLGGAAGKLCVALALLRSLGSVSTTHFDVLSGKRGESWFSEGCCRKWWILLWLKVVVGVGDIFLWAERESALSRGLFSC